MISQKGLSYNTAPTHSRLGLRLPELDTLPLPARREAKNTNIWLVSVSQLSLGQ